MAKTHAARIAALEEALAAQMAETAALKGRLTSAEEDRAQLEATLSPFEFLFEPGTPLGDLVAACMADPESADDVVGKAISGVLDEIVGAVEQNIHAVAEGHGLNPTPTPSLYAAVMKGFNNINHKKDGTHG